MTNVYFVRHAQPNYDNHDDRERELTDKGLRDRSLVTTFLEDKNIEVAISSPYKRAIDTIKEFTDAHGLDIQLMDEFRERRVGNWIEDFNSFAERQWADFNYKLESGESLALVQKRNIQALNQVSKEYENHNIVIGTHGTALSTMIHYYQSSFGYKQFQEIQDLMPWIVRFEFDGNKCVMIEHFNVFENKRELIYRKEKLG